MKSANRALLAGAALTALLAGCNSRGDTSSSVGGPPPPTTGTTPLQNQFGATFLGLFNQNPDSAEATEPPASAVPPVDPNSEPFPG